MPLVFLQGAMFTPLAHLGLSMGMPRFPPWQVAAVYARVLAYVTNVATNAASAIPPPTFQSLWDAIAAHVGAAPIGSEADYPLVSVASPEITCPLSQPESVAPRIENWACINWPFHCQDTVHALWSLLRAAVSSAEAKCALQVPDAQLQQLCAVC